MMNAPDAFTGATVAHAIVDAHGVLLSADPSLAALNAQAGGAIGQPLALAQLAMVARLARRLDIVVARRVMVADEGGDIQLSVRAQPEGERVRIAAGGWTETPAWRPDPRVTAPLADGGWRWEADAALRLTFVSLDPGHGFDPLAMLGRPLTALFGFDQDDEAMPILDALARRRPFEAQPAMLKPTGGAVTLSAVVRTDIQGGFAGLAGTARAVELVAASSHLPVSFTGELDRALRRPLARIVANADSINGQADGPIAGDYAGYAADIASAGRHLLGLVDDLVDLQAIERPDFAPAVEAIDLADLARRAAGLLAVRAEQTGVAIDRPMGGVTAPATGDFRRTLQILVNLIGNALRYSPGGSRIELTTSITGTIARVTVADTGKGIAAADHARIFDKFERIDPAEPGGSGLGLFIARRLARAMGGDLTVESTAGGGARFTLALPAGQPARH